MRGGAWPPDHPDVHDLLATAIDGRRVTGSLEPSAYAWDKADALLHEFAEDLLVLHDANQKGAHDGPR